MAVIKAAVQGFHPVILRVGLLFSTYKTHRITEGLTIYRCQVLHLVVGTSQRLFDHAFQVRPFTIGFSGCSNPATEFYDQFYTVSERRLKI